MSLELRWIFDGQIPDPVKHWFYHDRGNNDKIENQKYEDVYLYTPEVDYSSVKFRDKKLDIKWKRSSFEVELSNSLNISGIVEDWVFWKWNKKNSRRNRGTDNKKLVTSMDKNNEGEVKI
jgi:hypothetical protein